MNAAASLPVRARHVLGALGLAAILAFSSWVRIDAALSEPCFDTRDDTGVLRSDPGLLYYFVKQILAADGGIPDDFRDDPRVEYPNRVDLLEDFTIGEEFLVAWTYRWFGGDRPLHVWCVMVLGVLASLAAVGVYGLALELTGRVPFALLASVAFALLPANYRTIGFVLIREDLSLPLFALHLWLLARAARVRSPVAYLLAGLAALGALSSWHAMAFVLAIEAGCFLVWYLRSGENPLAARHAWVLVATVFAGSWLIPVLRSKLFALSLAMQVVAGLAVAWWVGRRRELGWLGRASVCAGGFVAAVLLSTGVTQLTGTGLADYSHVFELMVAKVRYLGQIPDDPSVLPFGARLLWQGPFDTSSAIKLYYELMTGLLVLPVAIFLALAAVWFAGSSQPDGLPGLGQRVFGPRWRAAVLVTLFATVTLPIAYLIQRDVVLPALVLPVLMVVLSHRLSWPGLVLLLGLLVYQGHTFKKFQQNHRVSWYSLIPQRQPELSQVVRWLRENTDQVPTHEPILSDFINSTAVLCHTGHPILLQPKYETVEARRRVEEFISTMLLEPPQTLHQLMGTYGVRFLLVDRMTVYYSRYMVGIPDHQQPPPGTAIHHFGSQDPAVLENIPGFRLLYRSRLRGDVFRLYERVDPP